MKQLFPLAAVAAIICLLLLSGCTELDPYYKTEGGEIKHGSILDGAALDANQCKTASACTCFACKNETPTASSFFNKFADFFFDYTLEEGKCEFRSCTETEFTEGFSDAPDMHPYFFMIGQGSNFAEFADATAYCNSSLRMAVKWLASKEGFDYPLPREDRARCILNKNALPVYILYSEGNAMKPGRASQIAGLFKETGPVILVSEMDFDPLNNTQFTAAVEEVKKMDAACPGCLIAFAPKFYYNESNGGYNATYEAIDAVFADPSAAASIDIVAVGVNSHNVRSCTSAETLEDALTYSKYILQNHSKPTLWAYVLLDQDWNAGGEDSGTCKWSESEITKAYSDLFKYSPALVNGGVIGVAPYSLYGVQTGPLNCTSCGMMSVDGVRYPSHTMWFSLCQKYYTYRGALPMVFSPDPGTDCSFGNNFNLYQLEESRTGDSPTAEDLEGKEIEPSKTFFRCSGQLLSEFPDEIETISTAGVTKEQCKMHLMLDFYADVRDMDPALTRAIAGAETGLNGPTIGPGGDTCEISQVAKSSFPSLPTEITDPDGVCGTQYASEGKVFHSLGVMQVHMYPYTMWADYPPSADAQWCAGAFFNPLNESHNACLGTAILAGTLDDAKKVVSKNEGNLGLTDLKKQYGESSPKYQNMKNAVTIFAAAYRYNGYTGYLDNEQTWMNDFGKQRTINETYCADNPGTFCCDEEGNVLDNGCCGITNFIDYVNNCKKPSNKYASNVLGMYRGLISKCDKYNEDSWYTNIQDYLASVGWKEPTQTQ